jgi:DNA-binding MarR family transcriptional regulator
VAKDRRHALLSLTTTGRAAYDNLSMAAAQFDRKLQERLGGDDVQTLKRCLRALMKNP